MNKSDVNATDLQQEKTCLGNRYNFKKGMESCPNKEKCALYKPNKYENYIRFEFVKDFRNCKKHTNEPNS